jgi:hypothetical protein
MEREEMSVMLMGTAGWVASDATFSPAHDHEAGGTPAVRKT